jgi:hypothetical protein
LGEFGRKFAQSGHPERKLHTCVEANQSPEGSFLNLG